MPWLASSLRLPLICAVLACVTSGPVGASAPPPRSLSLGNASDGHLVNGKQLPNKGAGFRVMAATLRREYRYGGDELVGAIRRAASNVATAFPGSVLLVGNMSRDGGGDIGPSVSHNSGRDVDIGFYATDAKGRRVDPGTLVVFDAQGVHGDLRFDAPRNWALVAALLTDPTIQVQWIFCKSALRDRLLAHARKTGASADLILRAEGVLGEPGNSSSHSEHFHVRLYCAKRERLEGCLNYGTMHAWVDDFSADVIARTAELTVQFRDTNTLNAVAAIEKVRAIRGHEAVPALAELVYGKAPRSVKLAALDALAVLDGAETVAVRLATALETNPDAELRSRLIAALRDIGDVRTGPALLAVALDPKATLADRLAAVEGVARMVFGAGVPALASLLADPSRSLARAADRALQRLTGRSFGLAGKAVRRWTDWWRDNAHRPRIEWVSSSFADLGVRLEPDAPALRRARAIRKLVGLMRRGGEIAFNARALIAHATGFEVQQEHFSDRQMYRFYSSWLGSSR